MTLRQLEQAANELTAWVALLRPHDRRKREDIIRRALGRGMITEQRAAVLLLM